MVTPIKTKESQTLHLCMQTYCCFVGLHTQGLIENYYILQTGVLCIVYYEQSFLQILDISQHFGVLPDSFHTNSSFS